MRSGCRGVFSPLHTWSPSLNLSNNNTHRSKKIMQMSCSSIPQKSKKKLLNSTAASVLIPRCDVTAAENNNNQSTMAYGVTSHSPPHTHTHTELHTGRYTPKPVCVCVCNVRKKIANCSGSLVHRDFWRRFSSC